MQCLAVCCSVLQCDAVCCSVLHYMTSNIGRSAYHRFTKDRQTFDAASSSSPKFPWEHDTPPAAEYHADPFAPPHGARPFGAARAPPPPAGAARASTNAQATPRSRGLYSMLEVDVSATTSQIKKAYMKLVHMCTHVHARARAHTHTCVHTCTHTATLPCA